MLGGASATHKKEILHFAALKLPLGNESTHRSKDRAALKLKNEGEHKVARNRVKNFLGPKI